MQNIPAEENTIQKVFAWVEFERNEAMKICFVMVWEK